MTTRLRPRRRSIWAVPPIQYLPPSPKHPLFIVSKMTPNLSHRSLICDMIESNLTTADIAKAAE